MHSYEEIMALGSFIQWRHTRKECFPTHPPLLHYCFCVGEIWGFAKWKGYKPGLGSRRK